MQKPYWSNGESEPHLTAGYDRWQEHPVLDPLSRINQGGQASRWAVVCSVRLIRVRSKTISIGFMLLNSNVVATGP